MVLAQLQHQAFGEAARAHARGLEVLQPAQRAAQPRIQRFPRLRVGQLEQQGQARADVLQRVVQVAVGVQRVDQCFERKAVFGREPHAADLCAQMVLQARRRGPALVHLVFVAVAARSRAAARGRRLADAVEVVALGAVLPVLARGGAEVAVADFGQRRALVAACAVVALRGARTLAVRALRARAGAVVGEAAVQRRLVGVGRVLVEVQEGVLVEHLPDLLVQLQRGELQQPDRLLQLRRQRQVLRDPDLQRGLHAHIRKCSPR